MTKAVTRNSPGTGPVLCPARCLLRNCVIEIIRRTLDLTNPGRRARATDRSRRRHRIRRSTGSGSAPTARMFPVSGDRRWWNSASVRSSQSPVCLRVDGAAGVSAAFRVVRGAVLRRPGFAEITSQDPRRFNQPYPGGVKVVDSSSVSLRSNCYACSGRRASRQWGHQVHDTRSAWRAQPHQLHLRPRVFNQAIAMTNHGQFSAAWPGQPIRRGVPPLEECRDDASEPASRAKPPTSSGGRSSRQPSATVQDRMH